MRALVTGGAGFIGSHLVDALAGRGDEVLALDDLSSGRRENLAEALAAGAALVEGSIVDPDLLDRALADHRPEVVFHLAAQIDVRVSVADPGYDLMLNAGGTIALLERVRTLEGCRFVLASTGGAIYGEGAGRDLPLDEQAQCRPDAPYGQSKLAAEGYVSLYSRLYGLDGVSLRLGNVYGPRQDPHGEAGVVAIFCNALLGGQTPTVFGDGRQTRDYVYVGDVADAFLAASNAPVRGSYNIGTGIETDVLELGRRIAEACGKRFEPRFAVARAGEVSRIAIDPSRAAEELGWSAAHSLDRGIAQTARAFGATATPGAPTGA